MGKVEFKEKICVMCAEDDYTEEIFSETWGGLSDSDILYRLKKIARQMICKNQKGCHMKMFSRGSPFDLVVVFAANINHLTILRQKNFERRCLKSGIAPIYFSNSHVKNKHRQD